MNLRLYEYNATDFTGGCLAELNNAYDIEVQRAIEQPHRISFSYPCTDEKAALIEENRIVSVDGQGYRLDDVTIVSENLTRLIKCKGEHVFTADAKCRHLTTIGNDTDETNKTIGVSPYTVINIAMGSLSNCPFSLFSVAELSAKGLTRIGADGTKIDFFPTDKINFYDFLTEVIKAYGHGEIYFENYKFAVVEKIGTDKGVRLSLNKNLTSLSIQRQTSELTTRLYAYGSDDMPITSVNDNKPYIDSPNAGQYGIREGYKDYSDFTDPAKIKAYATYDLMGEDNENRLDSPQITITGDVIDLDMMADYGDFYSINLGDFVTVIDGKATYKKRVISMTTYPEGRKNPMLTIGAPTMSDPYFAAWQKSELFKTVKKNAGNGGKIKTSGFTGTVKSKGSKVITERDVAVDTTRITSLESQVAALTNRISNLENNSATKQDISDLQSQIDAITGQA